MRTNENDAGRAEASTPIAQQDADFVALLRVVPAREGEVRLPIAVEIRVNKKDFFVAESLNLGV
jgi:hypothetical protein